MTENFCMERITDTTLIRIPSQNEILEWEQYIEKIRKIRYGV